MDDDEREYSREIIMDALHETNPNIIAAYLYGDEIIARQGYEGIGLSPFAGFEIAYHVMNKVSANHARDIHAMLEMPTSELLQKDTR